MCFRLVKHFQERQTWLLLALHSESERKQQNTTNFISDSGKIDISEHKKVLSRKRQLFVTKYKCMLENSFIGIHKSDKCSGCCDSRHNTEHLIPCMNHDHHQTIRNPLILFVVLLEAITNPTIYNIGSSTSLTVSIYCHLTMPTILD